MLEPVVKRYKSTRKKLYFRADAAFASPDVYEYLEKNRILYAIRIPANQNLHREIDHLLTRPVGRPPKRPRVFYHDFNYRAASWNKPRRVIAKVEWHMSELFPRVGFIVANMSAKAKNVVRFYNSRSLCERWIKEGKLALTWTRLSWVNSIDELQAVNYLQKPARRVVLRTRRDLATLRLHRSVLEA